MRNAKIYIGTSGWHYKHWKGSFYPSDTKDKDQFALYQKQFGTVEINNSFYRLPAITTFKDWYKASPAKFIFSVKASRFITHMKKLNVDAASIRQFFLRTGKLGKKLGPVLFQLPPHWKVNVERLSWFLKQLPTNYRYTFEFRNQTWYTQEVYEILADYNAAFCIYELEGHLSPLQVTTDFVYIRLHGPGKKYQGSYSTAVLRKWARRCLAWQSEKKNVYMYFDNDQEGYAAFNAKKLLDMIDK
jgi:uncharacterized protein YecE (DUF72 family)